MPAATALKNGQDANCEIEHLRALCHVCKCSAYRSTCAVKKKLLKEYKISGESLEEKSWFVTHIVLSFEKGFLTTKDAEQIFIIHAILFRPLLRTTPENSQNSVLTCIYLHTKPRKDYS